MHKIKQGGGLALLLAIALFSPITTYAQTTVTARESNFELIAVDGNVLVVRDQNGTRELTVPPDFRFTVDGKSLAVGDLKAGMKGKAVITTTTTQRPVYVTTIKQGTVTYQTARSIQIKEDNGKVHKFTQSEIDTRGIRLYMGDNADPHFPAEPGRQDLRDHHHRRQAGDPHRAGRGRPACGNSAASSGASFGASSGPSQRKRRQSNRRPRRPRARAAGRGAGTGTRGRGDGSSACRARAVAEALYEESFLLAHRGDHHPGIDLGAHAQEGQEGRAEIAVSVVSSGFCQAADPGGTTLSRLRRDWMAIAITSTRASHNSDCCTSTAIREEAVASRRQSTPVARFPGAVVRPPHCGRDVVEFRCVVRSKSSRRFKPLLSAVA